MTLTHDKENALITTAQAGTPESNDAVNQLLTAHKQALYEYAMKAVGDHDKAEDAVQNTMILAWHHLVNAKYKHDPLKPSHFRHWLLSLCKNRSHEVLAGRMSDDRLLYKSRPDRIVRRNFADSDTAVIEKVQWNVDTENALSVLDEIDHTAVLLNRILHDRLSMTQRRILVLYLCDYSFAQTARVLNLKKASVHTRMKEIRKILREFNCQA